MRVCVFNPNNEEEALIIREAHFQEPNREALREHVLYENPGTIVWFEDEQPPAGVLNCIAEFLEREGDMDA